MGTRKSAAEKLDDNTLQEVAKYFLTHTAAATIRKFDINRSIFNHICKKLNLTAHTSAESETLKHMEQDGYDTYSDEHNKEIIDYYQQHSMTCTCEYFSIKDYLVKYLASRYNVQLHSTQEEIDLTRHQKHGFAFSKTKAEKEQLEIEKYGKLGLSGREKAAITVKAIYGVDNVFQNSKIKKQIEATKYDRYGDAHFTNREKAKSTCKIKFGAEQYLASEAGQTRLKAYNQAKYGADYAFLSDDWQSCLDYKNRRYETRLKNKYSVENYSLEYLSLIADKDKLAEFVAGKTILEVANSLSITRDHAYYLLAKYDLLDQICRQYTGTSHYEQELLDYIGSDICLTHDRTILDGKELDIYIPSKNLAIEFNGTYWHSTEMNKDRNYHLNKSKLAAEKGIRLIHIYEYEWEDPKQQERLKLFINIALGRVKTKIYARQCIIKEISNKEAKVLNESVHLQGHRNAQITYGLFYNDVLVQLMSFSKTKYNRNNATENSWEIIRGCPGSNNIVVGGVNKLFKHFIKTVQPKQVFSYCDFNKFDGRSYELIGMKFVGYTGPDMRWILANGMIVNRQPAKHHELKEQAIAQIFGAGSKKYLWTAQDKDIK